ncbi:Homogentisate 1 [Diplonema papillatum]|nr:Homogentisate 1 [Diplonema papillatum]|eukprot:gene5069-7789_t
MANENAAKKRKVAESTQGRVPALRVKPQDKYKYLIGFDQVMKTEALEGAVPEMYNTPQKCPYGLYAEQLSGTAFTKPRDGNRRVWVYKTRPSAVHDDMTRETGFKLTQKTDKVDPRQRRWLPFPKATDTERVTFLEGLQPYAGAGDPCMKSGVRIYLFACNQSMTEKKHSFYNSDGDMLFVVESGELDVVTELGRMQVRAGEICVVQRGFRFAVDVVGAEPARGYVTEIFDGHFRLPDLGPIGANGLANPRDFLTPVAWYEDVSGAYKVYNKFGGELWSMTQDKSPFDVVGWHGNYAPYKYDLARFCTVNSVSYDHLDPSIFTVLTCQSADPGTAVMDFVIFPPRYMVQRDTFRPPYYHRNCMSEFMGNISGQYEAKATGFLPGAATLHSCMTGHGPDATGFAKASALDTTKPQPPSDTELAFMFETTFMLTLSDYAYSSDVVDKDYKQCWNGLKSHFEK